MVGTTEKLQKLRRDALKVIWQAIESVNPESAVNKGFKLQYEFLQVGDKKYNLSNFNRIHVIGAGKASTQMAKAIENSLMKRVTGGLVCTTKGYEVPLHYVNVMEADHPIPGRNSQLAARRVLRFAERCNQDDLIICVLSGGASAMWCAPNPPLTFEEKQQTTEALLRCGANIHEINTIRKHMSAIKGGRLAQAAYPATVVTLAISDVVGDDLSSIGSGPTVGDTTTFQHAFEIIDKYALSSQLPLSVLDYIWNGLKKNIKEPPRATDSIFNKNSAVVVASNKLALDTALQTARYLGYKAYIYSSKLTGEASEAGVKLVNKLKELAGSRRPGGEPIMLLSGGETTVKVRGAGKGGRNQELALSAALALDGADDIIAASIGTDGIDGPTDAAGAFADGTSVARGKAAGLDAEVFLANNNSYEYFNRIGDLIKTGPTGTNVMDLQVLIIG